MPLRSSLPAAPSRSTRFAVLSLGALALSATIVPSLRADENMFGYVYGSDTLPKGKAELYTYQTFRFDKGEGHYLGWDQKYELEYGITDHLQASLYVNFNMVDIENVRDFENKSSDFGLSGIQTAFKWNLLSPYKDGLGVSLYLEPGVIFRDRTSGESIDGYEVEAMLIIQKNFFDDTLIWSTNAFIEAGSEDGDEGWGPTVFTGLSYRFMENWYVGVEGHWDADFEGLQASDMQHWDCFAGPVLHYGGKKWWGTLSVQKNLASWPNTEGQSRNLDDHEEWELRLKLGYNF